MAYRDVDAVERWLSAIADAEEAIGLETDFSAAGEEHRAAARDAVDRLDAALAEAIAAASSDHGPPSADIDEIVVRLKETRERLAAVVIDPNEEKIRECIDAAVAALDGVADSIAIVREFYELTPGELRRELSGDFHRHAGIVADAFREAKRHFDHALALHPQREGAIDFGARPTLLELEARMRDIAALAHGGPIRSSS